MGLTPVLLPLLSQGEAGDDAGPIVALPPHEDLSPESSAASEDLEAGDLDARRTGAAVVTDIQSDIIAIIFTFSP